RYARKNARQIRRDLEQLEFIGLIRRGNQDLVNHLPADKRPVVWDLAIERRLPAWHFTAGNPEGVEPVGDGSERQDVHARPVADDRSSTTGRRSPAGRTRPVANARPDADDRSSTSYKPKSK